MRSLRPRVRLGWSELGTGVAYRDYGYGNNVLIAYAGWSVSDTLARHWVDRLVTHSTLRSLNVGKVYAVKGPNDSLYRTKEIGNSRLISHLLANRNPKMIMVAAHSSGAFVANEFFQ
ncbi:hypothetical protein LOTGIDRAFT_165991 [Lottia gigantea]|uniref:GPI inositol-deacylase n=1 Tax=Lottia gigantea TaxID=225164 RepID=V4A409_LOTGI|nr:hypothetical protein LOTGIDRAFT_165991 [Lottia gigantea]ESO87971.1 hypothetical protein LOTGIDRAFT_165991 [Lottia gigantea]